MELFKPPRSGLHLKGDSVFLAGSIEMGKATDWQTQVANAISDYDVVVFNPRRDDWDSSWGQTLEDEKFVAQVNWELDHLEAATVIFYYFEPSTVAPISLMELGLHIDDLFKEIIICCPPDYFRSGNVEVVAMRSGIHVHHTLDDAIQALRGALDVDAQRRLFYKGQPDKGLS